MNIDSECIIIHSPKEKVFFFKHGQGFRASAAQFIARVPSTPPLQNQPPPPPLTLIPCFARLILSHWLTLPSTRLHEKGITNMAEVFRESFPDYISIKRHFSLRPTESK